MSTPSFDRRLIPPRRPSGEVVVFFDGVCGLCNTSVDLILSADQREVFRFAPLQGAYAATALPEHLTVGPSSIVLREGEALYLRSEAALRIATALGGAWRLLAVFYLVPRPLRDAAYDFIARHRYRWFGKREACRLPSASERARFYL